MDISKPSRLHFISGLPRSGSSLLAAILRQNPRFVAGVTSPVATLVGRLVNSMSDGGEFASFFSTERRIAILRAVVGAYYANAPDQAVIFDTNRSWTGRMTLILQLFPDAHIICCVRNVSWIIDSVERLVRRNALQPSKIFDFKSGSSVYARVETLMDPEKGLVGLPWSTLREAWFGEHANRLLIVDYEPFVEDPEGTIRKLYQIIGEEPFPHDFADVELDAPEYDASLGAPGLHRVRKQISLDKRGTCLPPDLFAKYADVNFWLNPNLNQSKVTVLSAQRRVEAGQFGGSPA